MSTEDVNQKTEGDSGNPAPVSRRALLKGSVKAMPAILTLHSGAALARSSNLISAARYGATDRKGRTLCLNVNSVSPVDSSRGLYDLGEPARGYGSAINDRDFRVRPRQYARSVSEATMCRRGGTYYYVDRSDAWEGTWEDSNISADDEEDSQNFLFRRRWKRVHIRQGIVVSAMAVHSVAGSVYFRDV